jgi:hypothetical protein
MMIRNGCITDLLGIALPYLILGLELEELL